MNDSQNPSDAARDNTENEQASTKNRSATSDQNSDAGARKKRDKQKRKELSEEDLDFGKMNKASYIERALYQYLRKMIIGGYEKLMEKDFRPYFLYVVMLLGLTLITNGLYLFTDIINLDLLHLILTLGLLSAVAFLICGFFGAAIESKSVFGLIAGLLFGMAGIGAFLTYYHDFAYDHMFFQVLKLIFFISYVLISSISLLFIVQSFHTSLGYKVISLGNSPNRLFFQPILRLVAWIGLAAFAYFFFSGGIDTKLIGGLGFVVSLLILVKLYNFPMLGEDPSFEEKDAHQARMNFIQTLGFYNIYLLYQLRQSFSSGGGVSNVIVDLILLAFNVFYIVNRLARKVEGVDDLEDFEDKDFKFRKKSTAIMRVKKIFGEKGMILFALSIALGYQIVLMDSFINSPLILIQEISPGVTDLNVILHRCVLGVGLVLVFVVWVIFKKSPGFRDLFINRYDFGHAIRMLGDVLKMKWTETMEPIEEAINKGKEKVKDWGDQLKKRFFNH